MASAPQVCLAEAIWSLVKKASDPPKLYALLGKLVTPVPEPTSS